MIQTMSQCLSVKTFLLFLFFSFSCFPKEISIVNTYARVDQVLRCDTRVMMGFVCGAVVFSCGIVSSELTFVRCGSRLKSVGRPAGGFLDATVQQLSLPAPGAALRGETRHKHKNTHPFSHHHHVTSSSYGTRHRTGASALLSHWLIVAPARPGVIIQKQNYSFSFFLRKAMGSYGRHRTMPFDAENIRKTQYFYYYLFIISDRLPHGCWCVAHHARQPRNEEKTTEMSRRCSVHVIVIITYFELNKKEIRREMRAPRLAHRRCV